MSQSSDDELPAGALAQSGPDRNAQLMLTNIAYAQRVVPPNFDPSLSSSPDPLIADHVGAGDGTTPARTPAARTPAARASGARVHGPAFSLQPHGRSREVSSAASTPVLGRGAASVSASPAVSSGSGAGSQRAGTRGPSALSSPLGSFALSTPSVRSGAASTDSAARQLLGEHAASVPRRQRAAEVNSPASTGNFEASYEAFRDLGFRVESDDDELDFDDEFRYNPSDSHEGASSPTIDPTSPIQTVLTNRVQRARPTSRPALSVNVPQTRAAELPSSARPGSGWTSINRPATIDGTPRINTPYLIPGPGGPTVPVLESPSDDDDDDDDQVFYDFDAPDDGSGAPRATDNAGAAPSTPQNKAANAGGAASGASKKGGAARSKAAPTPRRRHLMPHDPETMIRHRSCGRCLKSALSSRAKMGICRYMETGSRCSLCDKGHSCWEYPDGIHEIAEEFLRVQRATDPVVDKNRITRLRITVKEMWRLHDRLVCFAAEEDDGGPAPRTPASRRRRNEDDTGDEERGAGSTKRGKRGGDGGGKRGGCGGGKSAA